MLHAEFQVDVNIKDNNGRTPMHDAAQYGQMELVRMLHEEFQVDVNIKDNNGTTPMHDAAQNGHMEMVCMLHEEFQIDKHKCIWLPVPQCVVL